MNLSTRPYRRILLASVGSYGDVIPFLLLGKLLQERGHDVTLLTSGYFTKIVEDAGLKIAPAGTAEQYREYIQNPNLIHPFRGMKLTRRILGSLLQPVYEYVRDEWQTKNSIIAASPYCMSIRVAQEKLNVPVVTVNLAPIAMGSTLAPPTITPFLSPERLPRFLHSTFGRMVHWNADRMIGRSVNKMRRQLGLKPIHSMMRWWHSPLGTISLFPEWFAPASVDWPSNHRYAGFPMTPTTNLPIDTYREDVERFLSASKSTILFYPGSNASHLQKYFAVCVQACDRLNCQALFVAPAAGDLGGGAHPYVLVTSFVNMDLTLPRIKAAVHHGGIGTIIDCLKAGVPQLIRPMFSDQPDNAIRVSKLGVGSWLSDRHFTAAKVADAVKNLTNNPIVSAKCQEYRGRIRESNGLDIAAKYIESLSN